MRVIIFGSSARSREFALHANHTAQLPRWFENKYRNRLFPGTAIIDMTIVNGPLREDQIDSIIIQNAERLEEPQYVATAARLDSADPLIFQQFDHYGRSDNDTVTLNGIAVSPIFIKKTAFKDNETLLPLFIWELKYLMNLQLHHLEKRSISLKEGDVFLLESKLNAKLETLKRAYQLSLLRKYRKFHNAQYPEISLNAHIRFQRKLFNMAYLQFETWRIKYEDSKNSTTLMST